ncbi:MAG: hypothetical protein K9W43_03700 [Candidatus Thorarchaeota archaeon]|nr:hypothetical protein [Candidatus Thorarchaeota archaeon]
MSNDTLVNTAKQRLMVTAYFLFMVGNIMFLMLTLFNYIYVPFLMVLLLVYCAVTFGSFLFGVAAKRGIDVKKLSPITKKVTVSSDKYDEMVVKHNDAYGHLYSKTGSGCQCILLFFIPFFILFANFYFIEFPIFGEQFDLFYANTILLIIISVATYTTGFDAVQADPNIEIKKAPQGEIFEYADALSSVDGIRPEVEVTINESHGNLVIMDAEPKLNLEGFPDEVQLKLQASDSGFLYPYIVATYYKGPHVDEHKERVKIGARYPVLLEYQMDGEVTVLIGRFDIPKRSSSVPNISIDDFRLLANEIIDRLRGMVSS